MNFLCRPKLFFFLADNINACRKNELYSTIVKEKGGIAMNLSVTNQAALSSLKYDYLKSDSYTENAIDESAVSESDYNISSLTNALDTLSNSNSLDFSGVGNLTGYTKDLYKLSQLGSYDTLTDSTNANVSGLLTNTSKMSDIAALSVSKSLLSADYIKYTAEAQASSSSIDNYTSYLKGTLLDTSV